MKEKYKIILDSNFLYNSSIKVSELLNRKLIEIYEFLNKHNLENVSVAVPEIVVKEILSHKLQAINIVINNLDDGVEKLKDFVRLNLKQIKVKNYNKVLQNELDKFLKKNSVEIIRMTKVNQKEMLDRALNKVRPFNDGDKGFKDTLIWLSVLENAKKNHDSNYILCTNNSKDFDKDICAEEFKKYSKKRFEIVKDILELKEYLDNNLILNLKLKELNEQIEEELKRKIGTITCKTLSYIHKDAELLNGNFYLRNYSSALFDNPNNNDNYYLDSYDINIEDITQRDKNNFLINLCLSLKKIRKNNNSARVSFAESCGVSYLHYNDFKKIIISLEYFRNTHDIKILSAQEENMYRPWDVDYASV